MSTARVRSATRRVGIARILLMLPFVVLAARAAHLSVVDGRGARRGEAQTHRVLRLAPQRGAIVDRSGAELALSIDAPSVYAVPAEIGDRQRAAGALARALGMSTARVGRRLEGRSSFVFVARWVEPERAERVRTLGLAGVGVLEEPRRVYPHRTLAASVVGFANIDGSGVRGIEQQEDDWLRGTARRIPVERDARGRLLAEGGRANWSTAGGDVALTIDAALQSDAETALRRAVERTGARGGVVLSMDPHSGEILSLAESPSFDPNRFRHLDYASTRSRAFLDAAEPGSTLKVFLAAAALEAGAAGPEDVFDCEDGTFRVPGKTIRDLHPNGALRLADILRVSSNIGAVKVAHALGASSYYRMLRRFGFGEPTGSGFPDESAGVLRDASEWRPVDHATIAFGQGVSVTPVQLAAAMSAVANGGERVRPRLVTARRAADGPWQPAAGREARRVLAPETAAQVMAMLEGVTGSDGTASRARLQGQRVAGKTGTAQKLDRATGTYADDRFVAWFVGAVPVDGPKLVVVAGLDEPRRPFHTGGAAAAPLFAEVAAAQLARFGIFTTPQWGAPAPTRVAAAPPARKTVPRAAPEPAPPPPAPAPRAEPPPSEIPELARLNDRVLLPDLRGLTVAEVRQVTAKEQIEVELSGTGRAVSQDPPPGSIVAVRETRVRVRFEPRRTASVGGEG